MAKHLVIAAALCAVAVSHADTVLVQFTALPTTNISPGSPYSATYNGNSTATIAGITNQYLVCDDFTDSTTIPNTVNWAYDYSTLTGPAPLQSAMYTGAQVVMPAPPVR